MATALSLTPAGGGAAILDVQGLTVEGLQISPRALQFIDYKFQGVNGVSRIYGGYGQRQIMVVVMVYHATQFNTAEKLSDYLDQTLNTTMIGQNGTLEIISESDHDPFPDSTFEGVAIIEGPKLDVGGALGGGYWAECVFQFTQLS